MTSNIRLNELSSPLAEGVRRWRTLRAIHLAFAALVLLCVACAAEDVERHPSIEVVAQPLQQACGCTQTGSFVRQTSTPPVPSSATFSASSSAANGMTSLNVRRNADGATIFNATAPVPTAADPNPAAFGFGPDGNSFLYRYVRQGFANVVLVSLSPDQGRVVYSRSVATTSSAVLYSPRGHYLLFAYLTGTNGITLELVDTASGAAVYATTYNVFSQTVPPPGRALDVGAWGFSADDEAFVSAYVAGQGRAQWNLINLVRGTQVASAQLASSGYWAFSPCADAVGLVEVSAQGNASVSLLRTSDGATLGTANGRALPNGVQLSTTSSAYLAKINNTTFQLAPNRASAPCATPTLASLALSSSSVPGGQSVKGTVRLSTNAPPGGANVTLSSSNPRFASVPRQVSVEAGSATALFVLTTSTVTTTTRVTITASFGSIRRAVTLGITAPSSCFGTVCRPPNQCEVSVSCDVRARACRPTLKPAGTPCDDANPNTVGDACSDGACIGRDRCAGVSCPGDMCHTGSCDPSTGSCRLSNLPDGTSCDDGNASTRQDVCSAGACRGTDPCAGVQCPSETCRTGSCDPQLGACVMNPVADGAPCDDQDASSSNDMCRSGVCSGTRTGCNETNYALNPQGAGVPSPLESDRGWGGGSNPWDIADGLRAYDTWARGLAFTGGHQDASGGPPYIEPAGVRHAVIDFGAPRTIHKLVLWWHGSEHTPSSGSVEYWNGAEWLSAGPLERRYGTMHADGTNSGYSDSDIYTFPAITGSKVRYTFDNSGTNIDGTMNVHGWLYELEAMGCTASDAWTKRTPSLPDASWPEARYVPGFSYDSARARIVMFGGMPGGTRLNDLWEWDAQSGAWLSRTPTPLPADWPEPRESPAMTYDPVRARIVMFGGLTLSAQFPADTWEWDAASGNWTRVASSFAFPPYMLGSMVYDSLRSRAVFVGTPGDSTKLNNLFVFEWDSATGSWSSRTPESRPAAWPSSRFPGTLAFDRTRGKVIMYGGTFYSTTVLDELWEWDGATGTWLNRTPAARPASWPPALHGVATAYVPWLDRVLVSGGYPDGADTWLYNPLDGTWSKATTPSSQSPGVRWGAGIALDDSRNSIVLFGGALPVSGMSAELWEWGGSR